MVLTVLETDYYVYSIESFEKSKFVLVANSEFIRVYDLSKPINTAHSFLYSIKIAQTANKAMFMESKKLIIFSSQNSIFGISIKPETPQDTCHPMCQTCSAPFTSYSCTKCNPGYTQKTPETCFLESKNPTEKNRISQAAWSEANKDAFKYTFYA